MDQIKIGKFISNKRKEKNITQSELAELLGITDRAISKWENGICMPDASNILELCNILNITINDLFSGEVVDMKENEKKLEEHLLEMTRAKEQRDKELLTIEIFIGIIVSVTMFTCIFIASFV
ncbi:MAG: helix-turn-helix transcriptional regulator [Bacilli bacterium]